MISKRRLVQEAINELRNRGFNITTPTSQGQRFEATPLGGIIIEPGTNNIDLIIEREGKTFTVFVCPCWLTTRNKKKTRSYRFSKVYKPYPDIIFTRLNDSGIWIDLPGDICEGTTSSIKTIPIKYTQAYEDCYNDPSEGRGNW